MGIRDRRIEGTSGIAEKRFIGKILRKEGENILLAQEKKMARFKSPEWFQRRGSKASEERLIITALKKHRFVDMKYRNNKSGRRKKKNHPIYNKIIFGHYSEIVKRLSFGFTDSVMEEMSKLED